MRSKIFLPKINLYYVIFGFLIIGALGSSNFYIAIQQVQIFRVSLFISLLFVLVNLSKSDLFFSKTSMAILVFYTIFFLWTTFVSIFTAEISLDNYVNFFLLYLFIVILIFLLEYNPRLYAKVFLIISLLMFFISSFIAFWEITTHKHLASSISLNGPVYLAFVPSAFYGNPNQLALTLVLMVLFTIGYQYTVNKRINYITYVVLVLALVISFFAQSKLMLLVLAITFIFVSIKPKNYLKVFLLLMVFFIVSIFVGKFLNIGNIDVDYIIKGLESTGSEGIRKNLYIDAFLSIEKNYTFGLGINNSSLYYLSLDDPKLEGIINPHNYLLEILINSGLFVTLLYMILNIYLSVIFLNNRQLYLIVLLLTYQIVLISGSSALFGWYHYMFYIGLVSLYFIKKENKQQLREYK